MIIGPTNITFVMLAYLSFSLALLPWHPNLCFLETPKFKYLSFEGKVGLLKRVVGMEEVQFSYFGVSREALLQK